jgi:hypothetical protein
MSEGHPAPALTGDQIDRILAAMAGSFGQQLRSPVLHWPSEQDLDYQDITFPALDGVPLEGWFIPAADKKLQWIHGTTRRWDGYLEFQRRPEPMLEWFAKHMD